MRALPQQDHCDLGIVVDDFTEDLRPNSRTAPELQVFEHLAGTAHTHSPAEKKGL